MSSIHHIAVIGGGPAGLRAAEVLAQAGKQVTVYDAMRSVGRKFLVAGKSGLNITHDEDWHDFVNRYHTPDLPAEKWRKIIDGFDHHQLRTWAKSLGIDTFAASSGKVFPSPINGQIKAAPLLRRWISRLRELGVDFKTQHRWLGWNDAGESLFQHDGKNTSIPADATILALGGASWPQTGSDGSWVNVFREAGVSVETLQSANCGWHVDWPREVIESAGGLPLKNLTISAADVSHRGELVVTSYGLEGGPIYHLGRHLRAMEKPEVVIDFKPEFNEQQLIDKMGAVRRNFVREARRRWKLDPATCALLKHLPNRGPWKNTAQLAAEVKACRIPLTGARPVEEAISSAGGICWSELDDRLMLKKIQTVFAAGEMLNWEAPTGGYLMQGCFATGNHAAHGVLELLTHS